MCRGEAGPSETIATSTEQIPRRRNLRSDICIGEWSVDGTRGRDNHSGSVRIIDANYYRLHHLGHWRGWI